MYFRFGVLVRVLSDSALAKLEPSIHEITHTFYCTATLELHSRVRDTRGLFQMLLRDDEMLLRFVADDEIALTNSEAERALRGHVMWRKGSYGVWSHHVASCFASAFCRWPKQPSDWAVARRNGCTLWCSLASRRRITPFLKN